MSPIYFLAIIMKKLIVSAILFTTVVGVVSAVSPFYSYAQYLAQNGIITPKNTEVEYRLKDLVLRQEVAAMAFKLRPLVSEDDYVCGGVFSDVTATTPNTWVCQVVEKAANVRIISSSQSSFRPESAITRAESLAMIMSGVCMPFKSHATAGLTFSSDTADWQKPLIAAAYEYGVTSHVETFRPNNTATRGEIFAFAKKLHELSDEYNWCDNEQIISGEADL